MQIWLGNDVYGYKMSDGTSTIIVVLNRSDTPQMMTVPGMTAYTDLLTDQSIMPGSIMVPPRTAYILK